MSNKKYVNWDLDREGFQDCWLWQFGEGPFEFIRKYDVLGESRPPFDVEFAPGRMYLLRTPESVHEAEYPNIGFDRVIFHQNWFLEDSG